MLSRTMLLFCCPKRILFSNFYWQSPFLAILNENSWSRKMCMKNKSDKLWYNIRPMKTEDIGQMIKMRRKFTFQDSLSCYEICYKVEPEAIRIAADKDDRVIGWGSLKRCNENLMVAGGLTVHSDYWKLGLAKEIMLLIPKITEGKINVSSMVEVHNIQCSLPFYPILENEYIIIDFESEDEINGGKLSYSENLPNTEIIHFDNQLLSAVLEYDRKVVGYDRKDDVILSCLDTFGRTVVAVNGSQCVGYGSIKLNIQGAHKVGPLYAESPILAEAILKKLLMSLVYGKGFAVTVLSNNVEALKLFSNLGKMKAVNNIRMYSKEKVSMDPRPVYAMFDAEFHHF